MHHLDPEHVPSSTYLWVLIWSGLGGLASFLQRVRNNEIRHGFVVEFIADTIYSAFAGVMAFFLCQHMQYDDMLTAIIIGISGHMGARAIISLEQSITERFYGITKEKGK